MVHYINADFLEKGKQLKHFWSKCVAAGRAHEGLRANWQRQLSLAVKECGFEYIRFHGLFHDEMFVYRKKGDKVIFNWQYIDELFDTLLEIGIKPFVELSFFPKDMAGGDKKVFWWGAYSTPPDSFEQWENLISNSVKHWIDRYGIEEVRSWYFELWNEPNLNDFWNSTKSRYFGLYKVTSKAIKTIDRHLRVGGPATSNFVPDDIFMGEKEDISKRADITEENVNDFIYKPVWVEDFLAFCAKEKLEVDFVSTHPYPTEWALDGHGSAKGITRSINATRTDLTLLREIVSNSAYPNAAIHLTEWSSTPSARDCCHDLLPEATFIVKANLDSTGLADSLAYWTFTDIVEEGGAGESIFHGGFGFINFQGIVKPGFHAYRFLNKLGDIEIARNDCCIVTRNSSDNTLRILAYNYPVNEVPGSLVLAEFPDRETAYKLQSKGSSVSIHIEITGLVPGQAYIIDTLDREHGNAMDKWIEMGMPEPPTREQTRELVDYALKTGQFEIKADNDGRLIISLNLEPWSIVSIY